MPLIAGIAAVRTASLEARLALTLNQSETTKMNWDRIEDNWAQFSGNVNERWSSLTDRQLPGRVQETYGMIDVEDDAQCQITDWQQRLIEIERTAH